MTSMGDHFLRTFVTRFFADEVKLTERLGIPNEKILERRYCVFRQLSYLRQFNNRDWDARKQETEIRKFVPEYLTYLQEELNQSRFQMKAYVCKKRMREMHSSEAEADQILAEAAEHSVIRIDEPPVFFFLKKQPLHKSIMLARKFSEEGFEWLNSDGSFHLSFSCPYEKELQAKWFYEQELRKDPFKCMFFLDTMFM